MKNILTNLITSAVLLFTLGGGLNAQTTRMHATVPFTWQVNGRHLNAGDYEIAKVPASHVMLIESRKGGKGMFLVTIPSDDHNGAARLVFHRYADQYFLAEIVAPGSAVSKVRVSKAEREAMQSEGPREMAMVFVDVEALVE